jgi:hypothetical protein
MRPVYSIVDGQDVPRDEASDGASDHDLTGRALMAQRRNGIGHAPGASKVGEMHTCRQRAVQKEEAGRRARATAVCLGFG